MSADETAFTKDLQFRVKSFEIEWLDSIKLPGETISGQLHDAIKEYYLKRRRNGNGKRE